MKKSPVPISALRDAVRRKSVGLSFTTNFSIFNRTASGSGAEDDPDQPTSSGSGTMAGEGSTATAASSTGDDDDDEQELQRPSRMRQDSAPRENEDSGASPAAAIRNARVSYVEPPEPPLPPPGGLLEAATKNVQGKMKEMMETFHEVTTSLDDPSVQASVFLSRTALFSDRLVVFIGDSDGSPAGIWSAKLCVRSGHEGAPE